MKIWVSTASWVLSPSGLRVPDIGERLDADWGRAGPRVSLGDWGFALLSCSQPVQGRRAHVQCLYGTKRQECGSRCWGQQVLCWKRLSVGLAIYPQKGRGGSVILPPM